MSKAVLENIDSYVSVAEYASDSNVSPQAVYKWIRLGKVRYKKIGNNYVVRK